MSRVVMAKICMIKKFANLCKCRNSQLVGRGLPEGTSTHIFCHLLVRSIRSWPWLYRCAPSNHMWLLDCCRLSNQVYP